MTRSMTAFASYTGTLGDLSWNWEIRGVNARGLDLRLRLPEGLGALEDRLRKALAAALHRGAVTVNLRLTRAEGAHALTLDPDGLDAALRALGEVQERAFDLGVTLTQPTAADVLTTRGVLAANHGQSPAIGPDQIAAIEADIPPMIADFIAMREAEGRALHAVIAEQIGTIDALITAAAAEAAARVPAAKEAMRAALARVMEDAGTVEEGRIAQELALIAVKADVTEEIDRLRAHVVAARDLLAAKVPAGRKFDFLAQEFNREANTLCAKAQSQALTAIGLDLKAVIDQMREQIQNVE